jgi:hypothetical protein
MSQEHATLAHVSAAATVMQHALAQAQREHPEAYEALQAACQAGATLRLSTTVSTTTGIVVLVFEVVALSGQVAEVMRCELSRTVLQ